ncbi:hypothetical protein CNR22_11930 [Sphingobacteriaceae bacterium]|nr:hypothetical protein CNR22_11930 [Sphingobacteriaceae bacterium]
MKQNYPNLAKVFAAAALLTTAKVNAQVASLYSFSQVAGTYNAITTGTVLGSTTSDDQVFADPSSLAGSGSTGSGFDIGFSFMFNNHTYDRLAVCNNGWITFGQSSSFPSVYINGGFQGISYNSGGPAILSDAVSGLATDIQGQSGSSLRVATIGTAPSRTCVVQFANYRKYAASGDAFNFQIRLCETTNIVEIQFGSFVINSSGIYAETGIRGDYNSDFSNLTTSLSNPWNNPAMGTSNTDQINASNTGSLLPANGQIYRWSPPQCSGGLSSLAATGSHSLVCPNGGVNLSLVNTYTVSGIVYSWASSASSGVGPFITIPNTNGAEYFATGITSQQWFRNYAYCLNGGSGTSTSTAFEVQVAPTTTATVPYFESFEGIVVDNELPNCSWLAPGTGTSSQTYTSTMNYNRSARTGSKYATFAAAYVAGTNYVYTNGIQLNAGVTYSASMWYKTEINGYTNVTNLELLYGTAQNPTGLVSIVSTGPATSPIYQPLANTFMVPTSGLYYIAVKATTNGSYGAQFLVWDDLAISVPCDLNPVAVALTTNSTTICSGQELDFSASGADTYLWSTGETSSSITALATNSGAYTVVGTNTLSGCTSTVSQYINVNQSPSIFAYAFNPSICYGKQTTLLASGAQSYVWTGGNNPNAPTTVVTPTITTTYSVTGINGSNCSTTETVMVTVNPNPTITVSSNVTSGTICKGETAELSGSGAVNFNFSTNMGLISGSPVSVSPQATTVYSVTGTNALGCEGKTTYVLNVEACVGINQIATAIGGLSIYPNPTTGIFTVELSTSSAKTIVVTDLAGRVVLNTTSNNEKTNINLNAFANGIYYVKVQSEDAVQVTKIIKN